MGGDARESAQDGAGSSEPMRCSAATHGQSGLAVGSRNYGHGNAPEERAFQRRPYGGGSALLASRRAGMSARAFRWRSAARRQRSRRCSDPTSSASAVRDRSDRGQGRRLGGRGEGDRARRQPPPCRCSARCPTAGRRRCGRRRRATRRRRGQGGAALHGALVDDVLTAERPPPMAGRPAEAFRRQRLRAGRNHEREEAASARATARNTAARLILRGERSRTGMPAPR